MFLEKKQLSQNQINKIRNENVEITTDNTEIQRIIRNYYQQLYAQTRRGLTLLSQLCRDPAVGVQNAEEA